MSRTLVSTLALLCAPLLTGCGGASAGSSPENAADAAYEALGKGNHGVAVDHFDAALKGKDASDPEYRDLAVARCEALAHVDAKKVKAAVASLEGLSAKHYGQITSALIQAKEYPAAADVMDLGVKALPDDSDMKALESKVVKTIQSSGDDAGNAALKGLGYGGGD